MAASQLDASVIIASYNQRESVTLALKALYAQKTSFNFEVIVADDGSGAETIGALRQVLEDAPIPARLVWQQDKGFRAAASRNNGIRLARGRILIMLDGDMVPAPNFVESHMRAHDRECVIAVGQRLWRNAVDLDGNQDIGGLWGLLRGDEASDRYSRATEGFELLYRHLMWRSAPWLACFSCNISVPNSSQVEFDEGFIGWGYEDYDLFYALNVIHGYNVVRVEADAYDFHGRVEKRETWQQTQYIAHLRNGFRFYDKWSATGLRARDAIPMLSLDPETDEWTFSVRKFLGEHADDFSAYVEMARRWLVDRGLYSRVPSAVSDSVS